MAGLIHLTVPETFVDPDMIRSDADLRMATDTGQYVSDVTTKVPGLSTYLEVLRPSVLDISGIIAVQMEILPQGRPATTDRIAVCVNICVGDSVVWSDARNLLGPAHYMSFCPSAKVELEPGRWFVRARAHTLRLAGTSPNAWVFYKLPRWTRLALELRDA